MRLKQECFHMINSEFLIIWNQWCIDTAASGREHKENWDKTMRLKSASSRRTIGQYGVFEHHADIITYCRYQRV